MPRAAPRARPRRRSCATTWPRTRGSARSFHFHEPEFSDVFGTDTDYQAFWNDAVQYHVTAMLNGHAHDYERFAPQDANGVASSSGVSEFVVGTGGTAT